MLNSLTLTQTCADMTYSDPQHPGKALRLIPDPPCEHRYMTKEGGFWRCWKCSAVKTDEEASPEEKEDEN